MKHIAILILLAVSVLQAEETPQPTLPAELQVLLKATGRTYSIGLDGTPIFQIDIEGGAKEQFAVFVKPDQYGNYTMRKILCPIFIGKEKLSDEIILDALTETSNMSTSRFQAGYLTDKQWGLLVVGLLPNSADSVSFNKLIEGVGITAANFKKKHSIKFSTNYIPASNKPKEVSEVADFRRDLHTMIVGNTNLKALNGSAVGATTYYKDAKTNIEMACYPNPKDGSVRVEINFLDVIASDKIIEMGDVLKLPGSFSLARNLGNTLEYKYNIDLNQQKDKVKRIDLIKTIIRAYHFGIVLTNAARKVDKH